jgi:hypothetical protein
MTSDSSGELEACEECGHTPATELEAAQHETERVRNELSVALSKLGEAQSELRLTKKQLESALRLVNAGESSEYVVKSLLDDWWLTPAGMQQLAPANAMRFKSRAEAEKNKAEYMKATPGWQLALVVEPA